MHSLLNEVIFLKVLYRNISLSVNDVVEVLFQSAEPSGGKIFSENYPFRVCLCGYKKRTNCLKAEGYFEASLQCISHKLSRRSEAKLLGSEAYIPETINHSRTSKSYGVATRNCPKEAD